MNNFMKSILAGVLSVAVCSLFARAANFITLEQDCTPNQYYAASSAASSTHSITGYGLSYAVYPVGADANFTVHHATRTLATNTGSAYVFVSSSSRITAPNGISVSSEFRALATNPSIVIHGLSTAATVHVYIDYCERKSR